MCGRRPGECRATDQGEKFAAPQGILPISRIRLDGPDITYFNTRSGPRLRRHLQVCATPDIPTTLACSVTPAATLAASFDHLVGSGEQRCWNRQAKRLGSFEIDRQFKCDWVLNRQISGLFALKDASDICACLLIRVDGTWSVTHQTASRHKLLVSKCRRNAKARRQCEQQVTLAIQKAIIRYGQGGHSALGKFVKGGPDISFPSCIHDWNRNANSSCRVRQILQLNFDIVIFGIHKRCKAR